ncbi:MAG: hypothetical protein ACRDGE_02390 [Candidatus Limnocylindria bacterium]
MAEPRPDPIPDGASTRSTPVWLRAFGLIVLIVVVLVVVLIITGGGHGPGPHGPA